MRIVSSGFHSALWGKFTDLLTLRRVPVVIVTHFPEEVPCIGACRFYRLQAAPGRRRPARLSLSS